MWSWGCSALEECVEHFRRLVKCPTDDVAQDAPSRMDSRATTSTGCPTRRARATATSGPPNRSVARTTSPLTRSTTIAAPKSVPTAATALPSSTPASRDLMGPCERATRRGGAVRSLSLMARSPSRLADSRHLILRDLRGGSVGRGAPATVTAGLLLLPRRLRWPRVPGSSQVGGCVSPCSRRRTWRRR